MNKGPIIAIVAIVTGLAVLTVNINNSIPDYSYTPSFSEGALPSLRYTLNDPPDSRAQDMADKMLKQFDMLNASRDSVTIRVGDWRSDGPLAYAQGDSVYIREDLYPILTDGAMADLVAHELAHIAMERSNMIVGYDHRIATHGDVQYHKAIDFLLLAGLGKKQIRG